MQECGAVFVREGGKHSVFKNPRTGTLLYVPRHKQVKKPLAESLIRDACASG